MTDKSTPSVIDDGHNPMIVVSQQQVMDWLRTLADEAGYADRETCAFQTAFEAINGSQRDFRNDVPELLIMVSNVKNSRKPPASGAAL